jgi:hypothetical protein
MYAVIYQLNINKLHVVPQGADPLYLSLSVAKADRNH